MANNELHATNQGAPWFEREFNHSPEKKEPEKGEADHCATPRGTISFVA